MHKMHKRFIATAGGMIVAWILGIALIVFGAISILKYVAKSTAQEIAIETIDETIDYTTVEGKARLEAAADSVDFDDVTKSIGRFAGRVKQNIKDGYNEAVYDTTEGEIK